jgi:hypothetical protein
VTPKKQKDTRTKSEKEVHALQRAYAAGYIDAVAEWLPTLPTLLERFELQPVNIQALIVRKAYFRAKEATLTTASGTIVDDN